MNLLSRCSTLTAIGLFLFTSAAHAQGTTDPQSGPSTASTTTPSSSSSSSSSSTSTRPATTTVGGDTGLWFVPTGEVLPSKSWSFSLSRLEANDGQGFSNISTFPLSAGVGLGGRVELFGSWHIITRIDRDTRPLFFAGTATPGTGGGIDVDYPLERTTFTGNGRGDLWVGGKINAMSEADRDPFALALRAMVKLPIGDSTNLGTSSGKADFAVDGIVSKEMARTVELSGYGGVMVRGNPDGYQLTNGLRWGVGAGFPSRSPVRVTTEFYGERYFNNTITAPAGLMGVDGSPVPTSTTITSPAYINLGVTFQMPNGFFLGIGANWNVTMASRSQAAATFGDETFDGSDYQVRLGYHPGVRRYVAPPPPPAPAAPAPEPVAPPAPRPRRPPTVKASCDPCTVEIGKISTVSADGQSPEGDALTYSWGRASRQLDVAHEPSNSVDGADASRSRSRHGHRE